MVLSLLLLYLGFMLHPDDSMKCDFLEQEKNVPKVLGYKLQLFNLVVGRGTIQSLDQNLESFNVKFTRAVECQKLHY